MGRRKKVSALEDHLGYWLRLISNNVSQSFARKLEGQGVTTAEWVLLRVLYDAEATAPTRAAQQMGMTKGAISKLSDRLVAKRFVARTESRSDGRAHNLSLTKDGRALVPALARLADQNDAAFFRHLSAAERLQLENLMRRLAERIELKAPPVD